MTWVSRSSLTFLDKNKTLTKKERVIYVKGKKLEIMATAQ